MVLTGKEHASLCFEKNGEALYSVSQINWHQLLNNFICEKIWDDTKNNKAIEEINVRYISINNLNIPKDATIKLKYQVFTKATPLTVVDNNYETTCKVKNFYNHMVNLFKDMANKLGTTLWNIGFDLIGLEVIDGKPLNKIKVCCSDSTYFKDYIEIINKYSTVPITVKMDEEENYYADIEVTSLDFLIPLEQEISNVTIECGYDGIIFSKIGIGYYCMEIYNGYRE